MVGDIFIWLLAIFFVGVVVWTILEFIWLVLRALHSAGSPRTVIIVQEREPHRDPTRPSPADDPSEWPTIEGDWRRVE